MGRKEPEYEPPDIDFFGYMAMGAKVAFCENGQAYVEATFSTDWTAQEYAIFKNWQMEEGRARTRATLKGDMEDAEKMDSMHERYRAKQRGKKGQEAS